MQVDIIARVAGTLVTAVTVADEHEQEVAAFLAGELVELSDAASNDLESGLRAALVYETGELQSVQLDEWELDG